MAETPQQVRAEIRRVAGDTVGVVCRHIVGAYEGDVAGARDALLYLMAAPIGLLTLLHKTLHPAASRREVANYLTLEFARRLDAWVREGDRNDWRVF